MRGALKVSRSTIAAQSRGSVKVRLQPVKRLVGRDRDAVLLLTLRENLDHAFDGRVA
jgi:hypothetical protein